MAAKNEIYNVHTHQINPSSREIYLHSYYTDDDVELGVEYKQATTFIKNLHLLDVDPHDSILVHLHSEGGCWDNGMAIFNAIQFSRSKVKILAYSQASSMSGIILQAASSRIMMPDCHFLMHYGWHEEGANHPFAVKNSAQFGVKLCDRMLQIFAKRAIDGAFFKKKKNSTVEKVVAFFDKKLKKEVDWYLDADQTVHYGLADGVLGTGDFKDVHSLKE